MCLWKVQFHLFVVPSVEISSIFRIRIEPRNLFCSILHPAEIPRVQCKQFGTGNLAFRALEWSLSSPIFQLNSCIVNRATASHGKILAIYSEWASSSLWVSRPETSQKHDFITCSIWNTHFSAYTFWLCSASILSVTPVLLGGA